MPDVAASSAKAVEEAGQAREEPTGPLGETHWDAFLQGFDPTDAVEAHTMSVWRSYCKLAEFQRLAEEVLERGHTLSPTFQDNLSQAMDQMVSMTTGPTPDEVASTLLELPPDATEDRRRRVERQVLLLGAVHSSLSQARRHQPDCSEALRQGAMMLGDALLAARRVTPPPNMWELRLWSCALMKAAMMHGSASNAGVTQGPHGDAVATAVELVPGARQALQALASLETMYDIVRHMAALQEVQRAPPAQLPSFVGWVLEAHHVAVMRGFIEAAAHARASADNVAAAAAASAARQLRQDRRRRQPALPPAPPVLPALDSGLILHGYRAQITEFLGEICAQSFEMRTLQVAAHQQIQRLQQKIAFSAASRASGRRLACSGAGADADAVADAHIAVADKTIAKALEDVEQLSKAESDSVLRQAALTDLPDLVRGALDRAHGIKSSASASAASAASSAVVVLGAGPLVRGERSALAGALLGLELEGRCPRLSCAGGPGLHSALAATAALNHLRQHVALPGPISPSPHPQPQPSTTAGAAAAGGAAAATAPTAAAAATAGGNHAAAAAAAKSPDLTNGWRGMVAFRLLQLQQQPQQPSTQQQQQPAQNLKRSQPKQPNRERDQGLKGERGPEERPGATPAATGSAPRLVLAPVASGGALGACVGEVAAEAAEAAADGAQQLRLRALWRQRQHAAVGAAEHEAEAAGAQQRVVRRGAGAALRLRWPRSGGGGGSPGPGPEERVAWRGELLRRLAERHYAAMECGGWREVELGTELLAEVRSTLARSGRDVVVVPLLHPAITTASSAGSPPDRATADVEAWLRARDLDPAFAHQLIGHMGLDHRTLSALVRLDQKQRLDQQQRLGPELQLQQEVAGMEDEEDELQTVCVVMEAFVRRRASSAQLSGAASSGELAAPEELQGHGSGDPMAPQPGWRARARWAVSHFLEDLLLWDPWRKSDDENRVAGAGYGSGGGGGGADGGADGGGPEAPGQTRGGQALSEAAPSTVVPAAPAAAAAAGDSGVSGERPRLSGIEAKGLSSYLCAPLLLVAVECERGVLDRAEPVQALRGRRGTGQRPRAGL